MNDHGKGRPPRSLPPKRGPEAISRCYCGRQKRPEDRMCAHHALHTKATIVQCGRCNLHFSSLDYGDIVKARDAHEATCAGSGGKRG